jgi:hypothetical protein
VRGDLALIRPSAMQQLRRPAVELGAFAGHDARERGLAHDRVRERQAVALEQVRVRKLSVRTGCRRRVELGQRRSPRAADGRRASQRTRLGRDRGEPGADHPRDRAGHGATHGFGLVGAPGEAGLEQRALQLADEQRIARRRLDDRAHERWVELTEVVEQRLHGLRRERLRVENGRFRERFEPFQLGRARGDDQRDRQLVDAAGEHPERPQAAGIGPVGVVDEQHQRLLLGEVGRHPRKPVQAHVAGVVAEGRLVAAFHNVGRELRGIGEQARAAGVVGSAQLVLEELADDPEGEVALELGTGRGEHAHPAGSSAQRAQQGRLALSGGGLHEGGPAVAVAGGFEQRTQGGEFGLALK